MRSFWFLSPLLLLACEITSPPKDEGLVTRTLVKPGPLIDQVFTISFFDNSLGAETGVPDFDGEVIVRRAGINQLVPLVYRGGNDFSTSSTSIIIEESDTIILSGNWQGFSLLARSSIPARPDSLGLVGDLKNLNRVYDGETTELVWVRRDDLELIARSKGAELFVPYSDIYKSTWPANRDRISDLDPRNLGPINVHPWDIEGTGKFDLIVYWFDQETSSLFGEPIQSGIFPPGLGIINGFGYFKGFSADTFLLEVSF